MNNKVVFMSAKEFVVEKEKFTLDSSIFYLEVNGEDITTLPEYLSLISEKFSFPMPARSLDGYVDWIEDLSWIEEETIIFVIDNFLRFMRLDSTTGSEIIEIFEDSILPWWESEVVNHVVEGKPKKFSVYLLN